MKKLFSKTALVGPLLDCTWQDHKFTLKEIIPTLLGCFAPIWLGVIVFFLANDGTTLSQSFYNNIGRGEIYIYTASILSPLFFIILDKERTKVLFPTTKSHLSLIVIICGLSSIMFTIERVTDGYNKDLFQNISFILILTSIFLNYLALVYNNNRLNPPELMKQVEADFTDKVRRSREVR